MSRASGVRRVGAVLLTLVTAGAAGLLLARDGSDTTAGSTRTTAPAAPQESDTTEARRDRDQEPSETPRTSVVGRFTISRLDFELPTAGEDDETSRTIRAVAWFPDKERASGYPLVVFAHGFATQPETYEDLLAELASAGFVVVAPESRPTRSSVIVPDLDDAGEVVGEHEEYATDFHAQRDDLEAAIDDVLAGVVPPELRAVVSHGRVGLIGHSDGGIAAAALGFNTSASDPRVAADVVISGAYGSFPGEWFPEGSPALLALHGDADEVNPFSSSSGLYAADGGGPKYLVTILGGGHLTPLLDDTTRPSLAQLMARFLGAYLHGERAAWRAVLDQGTADEVWELTAWED